MIRASLESGAAVTWPDAAAVVSHLALTGLSDNTEAPRLEGEAQRRCVSWRSVCSMTQT